MTSTQPSAVAWARVLPAYWPPQSRNLRHGAWYPVVDNKSGDRVTIHMEGRNVVVPRKILDLKPRRPDYFTIVYRVGYNPEPGRKSRYGLGKRYTVCPSCGVRKGLWGEPKRKKCEVCGHEGEIAWWE